MLTPIELYKDYERLSYFDLYEEYQRLNAEITEARNTNNPEAAAELLKFLAACEKVLLVRSLFVSKLLAKNLKPELLRSLL
jgi:hypothetical protein